MKTGVIKSTAILWLLLAVFGQVRAEGEHWTWNPHEYSFNATFVAVINIDGVEQRSDQLEIGAFYGNACRGSVKCVYEELKDRYFAYLVVNGEDDMLMTFRLWNHATNSELNVACDVTYTFNMNDFFGNPNNPYVFPFTTLTGPVFNGSVSQNWSEVGNWDGNALPTETDDVIIGADCLLDQDASVASVAIADGQSLTVLSGTALTTSSITSDSPSKLIIADGGQLVCDNTEGVYATVQKSVEGYGEGTDKWCFIASPLVEGTQHVSVENLVNEEGYDLYAFDQTQELEWRNFKDNDLTMNPGEGYLYANTEDVVLGFAGELNSTIDDVTLSYGSTYTQKGWNLIGNPFTYNVYADRSYYVLNAEGTALDPVAASEAEAIAPCTGIMVKASSAGEVVGFSRTAPNKDHGSLKLTVSSSDRGAASDCAVISFNAGDALAKFVFQGNGPQLSISQEGTDYAIVATDVKGELPVNFKAYEDGNYTLSVSASHVDMNYLHLIDNLTGKEVDLLQTPTYSFDASHADYATRFRIEFICGDANDDDGPSTGSGTEGSGTFAYYSDGDIVITDAEVGATLQIVDVTGRIIDIREGDAMKCKFGGANRVSTSGMTPGVYVLCLVDGDNVRVQKIVVR